MTQIPAAVLRNKGVPITLYRLDEQGGRIPKDAGDDGEGGFVTERVWVRFTANDCATIEEAWDKVSFMDTVPTLGPDGDDGQPTVLGYHQQERILSGVAAWQRAQVEQQFSTMRKTLSILLRREETLVGEAMIPEQLKYYEQALDTAWSMANGLDPSLASRILEQDWKIVREAFEKMNRDTDAELAKLETAATGSSPGRTSGRSGSPKRPRSGGVALVAAATSSGA